MTNRHTWGVSSDLMSTPTEEEVQDPRTYTSDQVHAAVAAGLSTLADRVEQADAQALAGLGLTPDLAVLLVESIRTDADLPGRVVTLLLPTAGTAAAPAADLTKSAA